MHERRIDPRADRRGLGCAGPPGGRRAPRPQLAPQPGLRGGWCRDGRRRPPRRAGATRDALRPDLRLFVDQAAAADLRPGAHALRGGGHQRSRAAAPRRPAQHPPDSLHRRARPGGRGDHPRARTVGLGVRRTVLAAAPLRREDRPARGAVLALHLLSRRRAARADAQAGLSGDRRPAPPARWHAHAAADARVRPHAGLAQQRLQQVRRARRVRVGSCGSVRSATP